MTDQIMRKKIPGYLRYYADASGKIYGPRGQLSFIHRKAYLCVQASGKAARVNRLICLAFHGEPPTTKHHAAHRDGNSHNNTPENLYWATPAENVADQVAHGKFKGERHPRAKLSAADVNYIRAKKAEGFTLRTIALNFPGLSYSTIQAASTGRNWK